MNVLLEVTHLTVAYHTAGSRNIAVNELSFDVAEGEVVGIIGESGSGKSTLALACMGLVRHGAEIISGSVKLEGVDLLSLSSEELRRRRGAQIALVTQNPRGSLNPTLRVGEQLELFYLAHNKVERSAARARARELLALVGINDPERRLDAFPHELSGGMAQRVVIAMALACGPRLLLADEPTSGLDVTIQAQILDDLRRAADDVGSSVVLVTQDLGMVANYCDRSYLLHAGEVVEESPTAVLFKNPAHPATVALLTADTLGERSAWRLRGLPVDGRNLPAGCWLHPRCAFAEESAGCTTVHPELVEVGPGQRVRCHRHAYIGERVRSSYVPG